MQKIWEEKKQNKIKVSPDISCLYWFRLLSLPAMLVYSCGFRIQPTPNSHPAPAAAGPSHLDGHFCCAVLIDGFACLPVEPLPRNESETQRETKRFERRKLVIVIYHNSLVSMGLRQFQALPSARVRDESLSKTFYYYYYHYHYCDYWTEIWTWAFIVLLPASGNIKSSERRSFVCLI